ncbi:hypothetical protein ACFX2B_025154 [Malus domestica]
MGGDFLPVYVVVGTIAVSMRLGLHTANAKKEHSSLSAARKTQPITLPEATIQLGRRLWISALIESESLPTTTTTTSMIPYCRSPPQFTELRPSHR